MENCGATKGFGFIYIYIYIDYMQTRERESFIAICKLFIQINTHKLFLVKMKWVNQTTNQKIYISIVHEHVD